MFARFARMSKAFNRARKDIEIAVKSGGPDPKSNNKLRIAIQNAKSINMPKDRIEAAIKRASSKDTSGYQEIAYEGIGPHGVAVIVETATDNPNRTVASLRHIFSKHGGSLGNSGSVGFLFEHKALVKIGKNQIQDTDEFELEMIDHGLEELNADDEFIYIYSEFQNYGAMQKALEEKNIEPISTEFPFIPTTTKELNEEQLKEFNDFLEMLEEDDDVQSVHTNLQ